MTEASPFDAESAELIGRGISQFNSGMFFECHDTLEEVWQGTRGEARDFLQGLIQVSVGFYHLCNGNLAGAGSQLEKGLSRLEQYGDAYGGVDLAQLRRDTTHWLERFKRGEPLRGHVRDLPVIRMLTAS